MNRTDETILIATRTTIRATTGYTVMYLDAENTESVFMPFYGDTDEEWTEFLRSVLQKVSAMIAKHNPDRIRVAELETDWREATQGTYDGEGDDA